MDSETPVTDSKYKESEGIMHTLNFVNENGTTEQIEVSEETLELAWHNAVNIVKNANDKDEILKQIEETTNDYMRSLIAHAISSILEQAQRKQQLMGMLLQALMSGQM